MKRTRALRPRLLRPVSLGFKRQSMSSPLDRDIGPDDLGSGRAG